MKPILKMMAYNLAVIARQSKINESSLRQDANDYKYYTRIPDDRRIKVMMGSGYTERQVERLLKRLESAKSRANQEHRSRTHLLRKEARAVHLARMYLKGTPYKMVEEKVYSDPNWDRVEELVSMASMLMIRPEKDRLPKYHHDSHKAWITFNNWRMGN